jgi:hypothetical protein
VWFDSGMVQSILQKHNDTSPGEYLLPVPPVLPFNEAVHLARSGMSYYAVVYSMRYRLRKIEYSASESVVLDLKLNLAVALMDCANASPIPDVYESMYEEGRILLESVLQAQPSNILAKQNLRVLLKNQAQHAAEISHWQSLKRNLSTSGPVESNKINVKVQAPIQSIQTTPTQSN